ncbi:MAG: penicillin-binding protein activator [Patescibacteria group bacterium]
MHKIWWWIGAIVVAVIVLWFLASYQKPGVAATPIKVGALLLLSGDFTSYGTSARTAVELAVEKYNADPAHLRKVEVIYEDTKADPKTAVSAYQKLVSIDHVDAIVGPMLQVEMSAIAPLVIQDKVPVFSISNPDKVLRGTLPGFLAVWPDPTLEAEQMAQYVYDQGVRSVATLGTKDSWESEVSQAFNDKFTALGGTVVDTETVLPDDNDTATQVTRALSKKPEALFLGTYYKFTYFVKKARDLGFKGKMYSIEIDTNLASETNPASNGLRFISPEFYTADFVQAFETKAGAKPTIPSGQTYDATQILLSIVPLAKDRADIISRMDALQSFDGVSGHITFNNERRATFPLNIFEIQNGEIMRAQ